MKPVYSITIGSLKLSNQDGKHGGILGIQVKSEVNQIGEAKLILPANLEVSVELNDEVEISLGDKRPDTVFSGVVSDITRKLNQVIIRVVSRMVVLSTHHRNALYEQQTCGNIARDLIGTFEIPLGKIDEGIEYPVYIIDGSHSVYSHLLELSKQNGLFLYANAEDQLSMTTPQAGMTHLFAYGRNIIAFEHEGLLENVSGVKVYGESPLSHGQGKEAYSWFASKEVTGSAGSKDGSVRHLTNPALKDIDTAQLVAENAFLELEPKEMVKMKILGNSKVKVLDQFLVKDIPGDQGSGRYECLGISHSYENASGFVTQIIGKEA